MVDGKWNDIVNTVNSLEKGAPFSSEKVKKKMVQFEQPCKA